jgi:Mn-dependent DtxR family transcriptional regulator
MYLETIYVLSKEKNTVRSIDVAESMGYSKPSVSRAVGLLKNGGYLNMGNDGSLTLTDKGVTTAKKVFERHTVLSSFLAFIGVESAVAAEDACKIEHVVSDETIAAIKKFLDEK